jgi:uncharacterized repeat protein (TIGR03803 family)
VKKPKLSSTIKLIGSIIAALTLALATQAQIVKGIYSFVGYNFAQGGLIADSAGNLYGTTALGGTGFCKANGCGTVFELSHNSNGWTQTVIYSFQGLTDGENPQTGLVFDGQGNLYGTTLTTVFRLSPSSGGSWILTTLHTFSGPSESLLPQGPLILDSQANIYGVTTYGGSFAGCGVSGCGTVYRLSANPDGSWIQTVLHSFSGDGDGGFPVGALTLVGRNLIGATYQGGELKACSGTGCGVVFQLSPSNSGWRETVIYPFLGGVDGAYPGSGLTLDRAGNLFGSTFSASGTRGTIFELSPSAHGWKKTLVHSFTGTDDGLSPVGPVSLDTSGNVFGESTQPSWCDSFTTTCGVVFELSSQIPSWEVAHTYQLGYVNGSGGLLLDANSNVFGMYDGSSETGNSGVFEIKQ